MSRERVFVELKGAPPLLLNARMHWRVAQKQKKIWYELMAEALRGQVPEEPWVKSRGVFIRYCGYKAPDKVNLASGFKWVEDALTREGIIVDDSPDHFESSYRWEKASPSEKRISIEVFRSDV